MNDNLNTLYSADAQSRLSFIERGLVPVRLKLKSSHTLAYDEWSKHFTPEDLLSLFADDDDEFFDDFCGDGLEEICSELPSYDQLTEKEKDIEDEKAAELKNDCCADDDLLSRIPREPSLPKASHQRKKAETMQYSDDSSSEFCTTAGMKSECGVITVVYNESPDCVAEIIFDTQKPNMVTIHRNGGVMNTLVLEENRRHISVYKTPIMPFEAATFAKKVSSDLSLENGGTIDLDYLVELRGTDLQRTRMTITVERI